MEFSEDLVLEVFSNLSGKNICKFQSVSRSINGFVDEDHFIKQQCEKMQLKEDSHFVLQPHSLQSYNDKVELHNLHTNELPAIIPPVSLEFLNSRCRVLASSNGLLFCRDVSNNEGSLLICNPMTKTSCHVPSPRGWTPSIDFKVVFDCNNIGSTNFPNDYMLITVMEDTSEWNAKSLWKVFAPKEGVWIEKGELDFGQRHVNYDMPVFHNGVVYFVTDCSPYISKGSSYYWPYIVALNVTDGTLKKLSLPKNSRKGTNDFTCRLGIFKWGNATTSSSLESICFVKVWKKMCCVWILGDYSKSSWTRIMKKRFGTMGFMEPNPSISGFTVFNGKTLLLATKDQIYSYDLTSEYNEKVEFVSRHECGENVVFHSYSSTLRPCGAGAESISSL